jgi:ComF family protein
MLCNKCGAFFSDEAAPVPVYCHKCDEHSYDKAIAVGVYEKGLSASIIQLKSTPVVPHFLKKLIVEKAASLDVDESTVVIPIPLARMRFVERGFNQADLIAAIVAKATGATVDTHSLARKAHTPIHRMGMDQRARELTVEKAFDVARPKLIEGKNILLVDDVLTSGSTASACAKVLKKKGSNKVNIFTIARAVMR